MKTLRDLLRPLASAKFTLFCIGMMMVLVVLGTVAQVEIGAFAAQREYFNCFWVWHNSIPIFPGGLTIGFLWLVNLFAATIVRFRSFCREPGLLLSHLGITLLVLGQALTQLFAQESMLSVEENQTRNYSELTRELELALTTVTDAGDDVVSIPGSLLTEGRKIETAQLPVSVVVKKFYPNSRLRRAGSDGKAGASQGIGKDVIVEQAPASKKDDENNIATARLEIFDGSRSLGTWLVSTAFDAPQPVQAGGKTYDMSLRMKRNYFPFSITLKEFTHEVYPGTDIPKNFSSVVHINYPEKKESRDALIYMNHPLRFEGYTFYQASYGKNDTLSVFQVVKNPMWLTPYLSCVLVTVGLLLQFLGIKRGGQV